MASYNSIICRYNEIATKGNNRSMFENTLIRNMKRMTKDRVRSELCENARSYFYP